MNNKPGYSIFKNALYAFNGLVHAFRSEVSFKLEIFFGFFIMIGIWLFPFTLVYKLILIVTFFLILIVELLNSAVENSVDLITKEFHPLAKAAKDIGASAVLLAVILHLTCWVVILFDVYQ